MYGLLVAHACVQHLLLLALVALTTLLLLLKRLLALRNDELAAVHAGRLIETVRQA